MKYSPTELVAVYHKSKDNRRQQTNTERRHNLLSLIYTSGFTGAVMSYDPNIASEVCLRGFGITIGAVSVAAAAWAMRCLPDESQPHQLSGGNIE